jgi:hypothetical protein
MADQKSGSEQADFAQPSQLDVGVFYPTSNIYVNMKGGAEARRATPKKSKSPYRRVTDHRSAFVSPSQSNVVALARC